MIKLEDIIREIILEKEYLELTKDTDQMLYEQYSILGELLDPNNSYEYKKEGKSSWFYKDMLDNTYFVVLNYQPLNDNPYFEVKTGWINSNQKPQYDGLPDLSTSKDWDKRSNTVAKIYRDEIIPIFLNQNNCNILKFIPMDIKRYQLSIRMINKFTPKEKINVVENKPKEITLEKI